MCATYKFNSSPNLIAKQEYRAQKWAYSILVPYGKLKSVIKQDLNDIYKLADFFDVTVEYMQNAIDFYIGKFGGIECWN